MQQPAPPSDVFCGDPNIVEELVVRVRSLTRAKAFLQANGLLAAGTAAHVALDPSRAFEIKMRFVE